MTADNGTDTLLRDPVLEGLLLLVVGVGLMDDWWLMMATVLMGQLSRVLWVNGNDLGRAHGHDLQRGRIVDLRVERHVVER